MGYPAQSESLLFVRRSKFVQNRLKIAPRSLKNAPKRPKTSNMGLIYCPRGVPRGVQDTSGGCPKEVLRATSTYAAMGKLSKTLKNQMKTLPAFMMVLTIQDAEITCLLKTMLLHMRWVGGWDCSQVVVSAMLLTPTPTPTPHTSCFQDHAGLCLRAGPGPERTGPC